jgi:hypothetical protein
VAVAVVLITSTMALVELVAVEQVAKAMLITADQVELHQATEQPIAVAVAVEQVILTLLVLQSVVQAVQELLF